MKLNTLEVKAKDIACIKKSEEKYRKLFEANYNIRLKATQASSILGDYLKDKDRVDEMDYETINDILNDVSFAAMAIESNIYNRIFRIRINITDRRQIPKYSQIFCFFCYPYFYVHYHVLYHDQTTA